MNRAMTTCMLALVTLAAAAPTLGQTVQVGPVINPANGHRYYRLSAGVVGNARVVAAGLGGKLATINTAAENEWVRANVAAPGGNAIDCLIGLNDEAVEGLYVWESGQARAYVNWGPGEPNNFGGDEDHAAMNPSSGLWLDIPGQLVLRPAIVEVEGPIVVPREYRSIQSAINAAVEGQEIVVMPGTYEEGINFQFKNLVVRSAGGPLVTTIAAPGATIAAIIDGGQDRQSLLEGFACRTQSGSFVVINTTPATVRNCIVRGSPQHGFLVANEAIADGCVAAGVGSIAFYTISTRPGTVATIQNCTIAHAIVGVGAPNTGHADAIVRVTNCLMTLVAAPLSMPAASGTIVATRSIFPGPVEGDGNLVSADPLPNGRGPDNLWGTADDDYTPPAGSIAVDAGSNAARVAVRMGVPLDVLGNPRFVNDPSKDDTGAGPGPIIDIGAVESPGGGGTCLRDYNGDGNVDPDDLGDFINAYFGGCP